MDLTPIKVAATILKHHGLEMCTVGELELNYYRICHEDVVGKYSAALKSRAGELSLE